MILVSDLGFLGFIPHFQVCWSGEVKNAQSDHVHQASQVYANGKLA